MRKINFKLSRGERAGAGFIAGAVVGGLAATAGTIWGGYEIGTAINDALNVSATVGRGVIDLLVMGAVASPVYVAGIWGGGAIGAGLGALIPSRKNSSYEQSKPSKKKSTTEFRTTFDEMVNKYRDSSTMNSKHQDPFDDMLNNW